MPQPKKKIRHKNPAPQGKSSAESEPANQIYPKKQLFAVAYDQGKEKEEPPAADPSEERIKGKTLNTNGRTDIFALSDAGNR